MAAHNLDEGTGFFGLRPNVGALMDRYTYPPMSVWDTKNAEWARRRRLWLAKGIESELGRDATAFNKGFASYNKGAPRKGWDMLTSIFDPVVCELAYGWWCKPGGVVLDPFAGGSVRGVVASLMGYKYMGVELRAEQVEANKAQLIESTRGEHSPRWRCGDSAKCVPKAPKADFLFSCPPYGNLETYSDGPGDISGMDYKGFLSAYRDIIAKSVERLHNDRFACFVVGNYRSKGEGRQMVDLVGDTIRAFEGAGAHLYNDIILLNAYGTGPLRANTNFLRGARKVVKIHQNVLVFVKGDPKVASQEIPVGAGASTGEAGQ